MPKDAISVWLDTDPRAALEAAAKAAEQQIPGHLGTCVSAVLWDHSGDKEPDPNIHELAHRLLTKAIRSRILDAMVKHAEQHGAYPATENIPPPTR